MKKIAKTLLSTIDLCIDDDRLTIDDAKKLQSYLVTMYSQIRIIDKKTFDDYTARLQYVIHQLENGGH